MPGGPHYGPKEMPDEESKKRLGLRGNDKQQGDLRDTRGGTYDVPPVGGREERLEEQTTAHEDAQYGADVRSPKIVAEEDDLPEGLRERRGPLNKTTGRR